MKNRYVVLDTETSGVDFCSSQVIQCAAIFLDDDFIQKKKLSWNINYDEKNFSWNEESEKIHKISKKTAKEHGISIGDFIKEFEHEIIKEYREVKPIIIASNAYFDFLMLKLLWDRFGKGVTVPLPYRMFDLTTYGLAVLGVYGTKRMLELFNLEVDEEKQHNALYDAELHFQLFCELNKYSIKNGLFINKNFIVE